MRFTSGANLATSALTDELRREPPEELPLPELLDLLLEPHAATPERGQCQQPGQKHPEQSGPGSHIPSFRLTTYRYCRPSPGQLFLARGLSASVIASPTKLNASAVNSSASPGNSMYHHWLAMLGAASEIIWPQLGVGG